MSLEQKDCEIIERLVYRCADEISVSLGRSFERLEECLNEMETRIYKRLADVEESIENANYSV